MADMPEKINVPEKTKSPIAIFIVLILVSLSLAGSGFYLLKKEKAGTLKLNEELSSLKIKHSVAESKLREYEKSISGLELKLKAAQANIDTLTGALEQETAAKQDALSQVGQLKADIEKQKQLRSDFETKLSSAQRSVEETKAQLMQLESKKAELEEKVKALEAQAETAQSQGVELGTIVVGGEVKELSSTGPLEGRVLIVNKDYNFVVINLGSKDGLKAGDIFLVYRNDKYLGDIRIEKVHDSMSAADFVSMSIKDLVSEGDKAVRKD